MRKERILFLAAVLIISAAQAVGQGSTYKSTDRETGISEGVFATGQQEVRTGDVECGISGKKQHESSDVLASPDHRWLAFAGVTAEQVKSTSGEHCANRSRLWLWNRGHWFGAYSLGPRMDALGNGMRLRGWSANSNLVAFDAYTWQRNSDGDVEHSIVLLEPYTGLRREISSNNFESRPRCAVDLDPLGFTADHKLLIRMTRKPQLDLGEAWEDEAQEGEDPVKRSETCSEESELLLFGFQQASPERVSGEAPAARFHGNSRGKMNKLWWVSSHLPAELLVFLGSQGKD